MNPPASAADHDLALLRRFQRTRDEAAFTELLRRHWPWVLAVCRRSLHDHARLAEDAAQEVFVLLARKAFWFRREVVLSGWLHRAALHTCRTMKRSAARRLLRDDEGAHRLALDAQLTPTAALAETLHPELDEALDALSPRLREAIVLRYLQGLSQAEAAARLGCPGNTVAKRVERGLVQLRALLSARGVTVASATLLACLEHSAPPVHAAALTREAATGVLAKLPPLSTTFALSATLAPIAPLLVVGCLTLAVLSGGLAWRLTRDASDVAASASEPTSTARAHDSAEASARSPSATPDTPPPAKKRFANSGDLHRRLRLLLTAASADEAYALLRELGVTLSREAADNVFSRLQKNPHLGIDTARDPFDAFLPYLEAWLAEDPRAGARWLLADVPVLNRTAAGALISALRRDPTLEADILAEFSRHPLLPALQAGVFSRRDPRAALELLGRIERENLPHAELFAGTASTAWRAWWKSDPAAATAWFEDSRNASVRLLGIWALGQNTSPEARALARELLPHFEGRDLVRASRQLALDWARVAPQESLALLAGIPNWDPAHADDRRWLGYVLGNWARSDPLAARDHLATTQAHPDDYAGVASGWAQRDPAAALAWAQSLDGERRRAAFKGVLSIAASQGDFAQLAPLARDLLPANELEELAVAWTTRNPAAALAWIESQPAGAERQRLALAATAALAVKNLAAALDFMVREKVQPDAELSFRLAQSLAVNLRAAPSDFIAALPADSDARRAAVAGAALETLRADPAAGVAFIGQHLPAAQVRDVVLASASFDETLLQQQPAWFGTLLAQNAASALPPEKLAALAWQLGAEWAALDTDAALAWAATLKDARQAGLARDGITRSGASLTPAQRAALEKLPPAVRPPMSRRGVSPRSPHSLRG